MNLALFTLTCSVVLNDVLSEDLPPPCFSEIFCYGRIIDSVMTNHIFNDSKDFVDLKLKQPPNITLKLFDEFMLKFNNAPTKNQLDLWIHENFDEPGSELENWRPVDHKKNLEIYNRIKDKNFKKFASDLNDIWIELSRKMKDEVKDHPELTSIIYVPNPFIIAGGRFREFYYWDSFWIIKGLIVCEMYQTARGILENFISVIDRFGFIPNGGRIYYLARSHPPLLSGMIKSYVDATHDYSFAIASIDSLVSEFSYFMTNKTVIVKGHRLARYIDHSNGPRPESYREDIEVGKKFKTEEERQSFYAECKAGGESGMDFSSRWFINATGGNMGALKDLKTRSVIAVELNAILYWNAKIISEFYGYAKNEAKKAEYEEKAQEILEAVNEVLWDETSGSWFDYDLINQKLRPFFTPTNLSPLWTNCFHQSKSQHIASKVLQYINQTQIDDFPGGVPNTLYHSGEQWDFPNVWAPMQYLLIFGLENLNDERASALAFKWAERWVQSNYACFSDTEAMFEKYVATEFGVSGGGGEYEVQKGFGWSNGAVLDLLERYGPVMKSAQAGSDTNYIVKIPLSRSNGHELKAGLLTVLAVVCCLLDTLKS